MGLDELAVCFVTPPFLLETLQFPGMGQTPQGGGRRMGKQNWGRGRENEAKALMTTLARARAERVPVKGC